MGELRSSIHETDDCWTDDLICEVDIAFTKTEYCLKCGGGSLWKLANNQMSCQNSGTSPYLVSRGSGQFSDLKVNCGLGLTRSAGCPACTNTNCSYCRRSPTTCRNCTMESMKVKVGNNCVPNTCGGGTYYQPGSSPSCENHKVEGCASFDTYGKCTACSTAGFTNHLGVCCKVHNQFFVDFKATPAACTACHTSCRTCHGTANTDCETCLDGTAADPATGTCTTTGCGSGKWDDDGTCRDCPEGCLECTSDSNCTSCKTNFNPSGGLCTCDELNGFYLDDSSSPHTCNYCPQGCKTCNIAGQCSSCWNNFTHNVGAQTCNCDPSTAHWINTAPTFHVCTACPQGCSECSDASTCSACRPNFTQVGNSCNCVASESKYLDTTPAIHTCNLCPQGCDTCTSNTNCTACRANFVPSGGLCNCDTPNGFYLDTAPAIHTCSHCHGSCSQCSGTSSNECTSCRNNFNPSSGSCVCDSANVYWLDTANPNVHVCNECPQGCSQCTSNTNCTNCDTNFVPNANLCDCPTGFWTNTVPARHACPQCSQDCEVCSDGSTCTQCNATTIL